MLSDLWNRNSDPYSKIMQWTILCWNALQWEWEGDWKLYWWTFAVVALTIKGVGVLCLSLFPLLWLYLQLEIHGVPGVLGAHVRVQEHKLDQEIFLVYNHAVATQQRHKFVRVWLHITLSKLSLKHQFMQKLTSYARTPSSAFPMKNADRAVPTQTVITWEKMSWQMMFQKLITIKSGPVT